MVRNSRAIEEVAMVKAAAAAAAAAQVGVRTASRATKKRSRNIELSIKVRSNVTNSRQHLIISSENSVSYPPDVSSGHRKVTKERCSSPSLDDDDDHALISSTSCCSSNGSCDERIKFTDLEEERVEAETSMYYSSSSSPSRGRERTSSDLGGESTSENMDSTATTVPLQEKPNSHQISTATTVPLEKPNSHQISTAAPVIRITDEEIKKFLGEIEEKVPQHFKDKYNFDFDKDEPLEGRYEWVRINP